MYILLSIVRQSGPGGPNSSRAAARRRPQIWIWCRHARRHRLANSHVHGYVLQLAGILPTILLRAWILQDLRRTEMRGYGIGGNKKGHAALAKRPNKGLRLCSLSTECVMLQPRQAQSKGTVCPRHGPLRCSSYRIVRP